MFRETGKRVKVSSLAEKLVFCLDKEGLNRACIYVSDMAASVQSSTNGDISSVQKNYLNNL